MMKVVFTEKAPAPVGPYSQGILIEGIKCSQDTDCKLLFISGMVPIDPATGKGISGNFEEQVRRVMLNLRSVLEEIGGDLKNVVKVTVFLSDITKFDSFNKVYGEFFKDYKPARSVVEAKPPRGFEIEIEAVAFITQ
ncbi:MAG TPA: deaminase [Fervidicoccus fontis]|uniref:Deaminase n=1 Tax=Fervidicoccus fontis TaxID=683846 RepID=A0A7C2YE26_9CREN|nr:MAG: deaminase [Fervidicoccus sp.]HEU98059.1 deaminase [Fervidicoccus fontis]